MNASLVMTILSKDRTGIVETVARHVAEHGGNWLDSRMCRLGGHFAGILRVEVPEANREALCSVLALLAREGLMIHPHEDRSEIPREKRVRLDLEVVGNDRPGIVRQISHSLARLGVNVEEFSSGLTSAPMSGANLFTARAKVALPPNCSLGDLQTDLEGLGNELVVTLVPESNQIQQPRG